MNRECGITTVDERDSDAMAASGTHYAGLSAHRVWNAIYEENYFGMSEWDALLHLLRCGPDPARGRAAWAVPDRKLTRVVDVASAVGRFDEMAPFRSANAAGLKEEFKEHFRNIRCITAGIVTALKVLFELDEKTFDPKANTNVLPRSEDVALITLHRLVESLHMVQDFRRMWVDTGSDKDARLVTESASKNAYNLLTKSPQDRRLCTRSTPPSSAPTTLPPPPPFLAPPTPAHDAPSQYRPTQQLGNHEGFIREVAATAGRDIRLTLACPVKQSATVPAPSDVIARTLPRAVPPSCFAARDVTPAAHPRGPQSGERQLHKGVRGSVVVE
ncbi:hypothetical protein C8Q78DRAFT_1083664 [Trametes maxima]|nr:hypothetical protein C8Q78DRAFT_1083664 [Trametes maxima]